MNNARILRVPPHDIDAERALIGSVMLRPRGLLEISSQVKTEYFYEQKNRDIYVGMLDLTKKQQPIDLVSLTAKLRELGTLDGIGGPAYLSEIISNVPTSTNIEYYAKIVEGKAIHRKLIEAGDDIAELGFSDSDNTKQLLEKASMKVLNIAPDSNNDSPDIASSFREFEDIQKEFEAKQFDDTNKYIGIPCGFEKIDSAIDGLRKGHLWIVGGYTSTGKTWFSLNIINNLIAHTPTTFFSLEMSKADIVSRLLAIQSGIGSTQIQRHEFRSATEVETYDKAKERLLNGNLKVYASLKMTLDEMVLTMTRDILKNKTRVFVIDYMQQIRVGNKEEYAALTEVSTTLQAFALKTNTTIIALSQISNEGAREMSKEHMSFKGSGAIGASADLAIQLMYQPKDMSKEKRMERVRDGLPLEVEVVVMKNRHGRIGEMKCGFTPWNGQFETIPTGQLESWRLRKGITTFTAFDTED